jgi:hypothetical protein
MFTTLYNDLKHYAAVACLLVVVYFVTAGLMDRYKTDVLSGPHAVSTAPAPTNQTLSDVANAIKDKAIADALSGRGVDLSIAQQSLANALTKATSINAELAGALAEGLTSGAPKVQTVTVNTSVTPPPKLPTDDRIQADMKSVLASTTIKTQVQVGWADKPYSPVFALYSSNGSTGVGYTLHSTPALNLDALLTVPTGSQPGLGFGVGLEHIFRGTSAGLGVDATFNTAAHRVQYGVFAAVHS